MSEQTLNPALCVCCVCCGGVADGTYESKPVCFECYRTGKLDSFPSPNNAEALMGLPSPIKAGDHVIKEGGDYRFEGVVVALFTKLSGKERCVVENADGILHIFSLGQLRKV